MNIAVSQTGLKVVSEYTNKNDWYYEGNISKRIVNYLKANEYRILKDNSDNCKARGEDIIALSPLGFKEIIEVKGYPTIYHTKGDKKGLVKKTDPKLQAKHWFGEAILSCQFNYGRHHKAGKLRLAIGLPYMERYIELIEKVKAYYTNENLSITVYLVHQNGQITVTNLMGR